MSTSKENVIREKRTIEATKKNLMGPSGKFGSILQAFGSPIMRQGTGLMDVSYLEDAYKEEVYTEYSPTMSDQQGPVAYRDELQDSADEFVHNEGLLFDGLSRGIHLDITYWHATNEIKVHYRGYLVYKEVAGELDAYAPFPEWEDLIERLYRAAKDKLKNLKKQQEQIIAERISEKKKAFWQTLRTRWGV
jgi:hypothetical protein